MQNNEEPRKKRKYTRRQRIEPLNVYSVVVTVKRGRKAETLYAESVRTEGGCLVVVSMDGPPPLVEKTRYIPLGSAEIEVCERPRPIQYQYRPMPQAPELPNGGYGATTATPTGPQIQPGPLEIARQRGSGNFTPVPRPRQEGIVERNPDGVPVVTAGFLDGSPS